MNKLTLTPQPDGSAPRLVLNQTKEDLQAAPDFKSAAQQAAERQQPATSTSTNPAPAPAPAN
ncbi:MAG: PRC-barrel domain containing protein, partial [Parvibaculaceae bacterium]